MDRNRSQTMELGGGMAGVSGEEGRMCAWEWEKQGRKV